MKVENMESSRGNKIANQFIITDDENGKTVFQSYKSIIVMIRHGETFLDVNKWDYSVTTGKYRNQFLNETKKETQRKINSGIYKLVDLNSSEL
jgi:hypothetical protein